MPRVARVCSTIDCGKTHDAHGFCRSCNNERRAKAKAKHPAVTSKAENRGGIAAFPEPLGPLQAGHKYRLTWTLGLREYQTIATVCEILPGPVYRIREIETLHNRYVAANKIISAQEIEAA